MDELKWPSPCKPEPAADESLSQSLEPPFSILSSFHEDVLISILSYVADIPFERRANCGEFVRINPIDPRSSLTHALPLVSKQFHRLCSSHDLFWKCAMLRLLRRKGDLWEQGLKRFICDAECQHIRDRIAEQVRGVPMATRRALTASTSGTAVADAVADNDNSELQPQCAASALSGEELLLDRACRAMQDHPPQNHTATSSGIYQCIYQSIFHQHLRYQGPVFYMPTSIRLGVEYGLHFFEPRYRLLIAEVMSSYPVSARRGQTVQPFIPGVQPATMPVRDEALRTQIRTFLHENESLLNQHHLPTFIHAHQSPLQPETPATIVQVRHCQIEADGRADVLLRPVAYIWLERIMKRPGTGGLFEARGMRMEKDASDRYEMWCAVGAFGRGGGEVGHSHGRGWTAQMWPIP